jgi:hypothetical protein
MDPDRELARVIDHFATTPTATDRIAYYDQRLGPRCPWTPRSGATGGMAIFPDQRTTGDHVAWWQRRDVDGGATVATGPGEIDAR